MVRLSELNNEHRIDAECYRKSFLQFEKAICSKKYTTVGDVARFLIGPFGSAFDTANYIGNGKYRYVRGQDVKPFILKDDDCRYVPKADFNRLSKYALKENDVLVSVVGTLGNACIVEKKDLPAIFSCKSTVIRAEKINPIVLLAYLNCKYGRELLLRKEHGAIQKGLNLDDLKSLLIPVFTGSFQQKIETLVKSAHAKLAESKSLYAQAEDTLLCELGLKDWQPKNEAVSIKSFSDFASSGRLDAEYYQSKYDELFEKLSKFPQIKIKDVINYPVSSGSTPKAGDSEYYSDEKTGIPFLRAVDIIQSRIDLNDLMYIKSRVHNGLLKRTQLHKGDVLFSIAGTVGRCGIFDYDFEANINQAIAILRFDESVVKHLYVIQFFNSKIGQLVIEKYARQGLQTNLNLEELSNLPIPILPQEIQKQIAELIQTSFALRQESKQLLEQAKRVVEEEIEK